MIINWRDGNKSKIPTDRPPDEKYKLHVDIEMEENEHSLTLKMPNGVFIVISHFKGLGSGVSIYEDVEHNPVVTWHSRGST